MPPFLDARIPVQLTDRLEPSADAEVAYLLEGEAASPGVVARRFDVAAPAHITPDCACCVPVGPVAAKLHELFIERAKGGPFFRRVLAIPATPHGRAAIYAALSTDPLIVTRFRLEAPSEGAS